MKHPPDLTDAQWRAVSHVTGPLLVLAGPGSGKTRVITRRIQELVRLGVDSRQILAITFTNKAADEMAARVNVLVPENRAWISTFHRFCARLLRHHAEAVGLTASFSILDASDQQALMRRTLRELDIDPVHFPPARIAQRISRLKNDLLSPAAVHQGYEQSVGDHLQAVVAQAYPVYQQLLQRSNSVDFDDLLLHVVTLWQTCPELRSQYDDRFRHILVDEYQDTNRAQYEIISGMSVDHTDLCVTGGPGQAIYCWRGAGIENILRVEREFPEVTTVRLEQNFRSTARILRAADQLISHNTLRKPKALQTDNPDGQFVTLRVFTDGQQESDTLAHMIHECVRSGARSYSDFAMFYRVNALSRQLELALSRHGVPYQVAAGTAFYERMEVKDLLAYLRLINNPADEVAFLRIVNTPPRGIGKTTLSRLMGWARTRSITLLAAARQARDLTALRPRAVAAIRRFTDLLDELAPQPGDSVGDVLARIIEQTEYLLGWVDSSTEQDQQRVGNVNELLTAARQYDRTDAETASLDGFLESCSLVSDVDQLERDSGRVTLMTLHAAKGLEFPAVFIVGVEHNLIPHERSLRENQLSELEEERRLLFVGMTRAQQELCLTQAMMRESRGRALHTIPSDFLAEMTLKRIEECDTFSAPPSETGPRSDASHSAPSRPALPAPTGMRIVRGSDLLTGHAGSAASVPLPQGFAMGAQVRHPQYGRGIVISLGGMSKRRTVTVEFERGGRTETFVAAQCPLQPIGQG
ncbi:MAG: UvrD-helicase domain-containing protein [Planctomycetaceae bacterium]